MSLFGIPWNKPPKGTPPPSRPPKTRPPKTKPPKKAAAAVAFAVDLLAVIGLPVATLALLVVVQADALGYLPAPTVPWTPTPSVMHPAEQGMGRSPRAALLDALEAERWRAER